MKKKHLTELAIKKMRKKITKLKAKATSLEAIRATEWRNGIPHLPAGHWCPTFGPDPEKLDVIITPEPKLRWLVTAREIHALSFVLRRVDWSKISIDAETMGEYKATKDRIEEILHRMDS